MILTLQSATENNGIYTWRFPKMRFVSNIITCTSAPFCCIYGGTENECTFPSQTKLLPLLLPFVFKEDYYSIQFTEDVRNMMPIYLSELIIELTECELISISS